MSMQFWIRAGSDIVLSADHLTNFAFHVAFVPNSMLVTVLTQALVTRGACAAAQNNRYAVGEPKAADHVARLHVHIQSIFLFKTATAYLSSRQECLDCTGLDVPLPSPLWCRTVGGYWRVFALLLAALEVSPMSHG